MQDATHLVACLHTETGVVSMPNTAQVNIQLTNIAAQAILTLIQPAGLVLTLTMNILK